MRGFLRNLLNASQPQHDAVEAVFAEAADRYVPLRDICVSAVQRWEWSSTLPRYSLDPLYFFDDELKRGRAAKGEPANKAGRHVYGFDVGGRIVVEREHVEFPGQFYETFFLYSATEITSYHYSYAKGKEPINCQRLGLTAGIPTSFHAHATGGSTAGIYVPEAEVVRYFARLYMRNGREPFGHSGELVFCGSDVEMWIHSGEDTQIRDFVGPRSLYNTFFEMGANHALHADAPVR